MALLQNQTINAQYPRRFNNGVNSGDRAMWGRSDLRNVFFAPGWSQKSGIPAGHLAPSSWVLPQQTGGMSSHNSAEGVASFTGSIAEGRNIAGAFAGTATFEGTGQLVVSGVGTFAGVAAFSGNVTAALGATGTFAGVGAFEGTLLATGNMTGAFAGSASFGATEYAVGSMSGSFAPAVTLEAAGFSGYLLDQEDIESGLTLRQALRLVAAATAGKISGGGSSTVTIRNAVADGADRIVATVDSQGNRTAITYTLT
jgi:hypothetical protein